MTKPTETELDLAIGWLRCNEGADGEAAACNRVADWIDAQMLDNRIRKAAREAGLPVAKVRARLKQQST